MDIKTLALYLGCKAQLSFSDEPDSYEVIIDCAALKRIEDFPDETALRPILRPLSSMTEEEKEELAKVVAPKAHKWKVDIHFTGAITIETWASHHSILDNYSPSTFIHLLSKGFDLFGLIEKGEAIELPSGI